MTSPTIQIKIGLYTPKEQWMTTDIHAVAPLIAQHIDEPTGIYLPLSFNTGDENVYRFQPLWDFDDKMNPARALHDARHFVEERLIKKGIPMDDLIPFASGRKGIHIAGGHLLPEREDWYEIFTYTAERIWIPDFPTLDAGIYLNRALVRAPWSRHSAVNARKKPLPWDLFWRGEWADISAWATEPLNDSQYADIELLLEKCLPTDEPTPAYWTPFADHLVLDFRQHTLTTKAIAAAKFIRPFRRFKGDWAAILDEASLDYRERKNRNGIYFQLRECPYCHRSDKAYVTFRGTLRCFRTGCEAHEGIPATVWAEYLGVHLDEDKDETETVASLINRDMREPLLSAEEASQRLRLELERIHSLPPGVALLVMSTPGIGKTTHALEHVKHFAGRVIVAAPTKERARELIEQYEGNDAQLLLGRCEDNCQDYERVRLVGSKGYLPGKVVCPGCPFFPKNASQAGTPECAYYQQFLKPPRVLFCTYEQAVYLHEADRLDADLILFDEDPTRAFMRKREMQMHHLQFNVTAFELPVRRFVRFLQHTLAQAAEETDEKHAVYRSRLLADLLLLSADQLGMDLDKLLGQVANCMENVYDRPARLAQTEISQLERIPPADLLSLAGAIRGELSHQEEDWNSTLSISVNRGVATLHFYQRFVMNTQTPLVILDAYGREGYYQALLKRDVETIRVDAKIHATIIKIKLATSKRAFRARHDALMKRLDEVISHHEGRKILVYTHARAIEEEVQQRYPFVATQHFWSGRGKDEFKDYDVVIIFGTAEPNPQELLSECRALYANDPIPVTALPLPQDHRHRADERLETLLLMRREEEMSQAAHRPRPAWAEAKPKTIIIMSHLSLPGLAADLVMDPRAIQSKKRQELLAAFLTDCIDEMGFYFDGLAELAGIVLEKSKTVAEFRQRLGSTGSLMEHAMRQPVQPCDSAEESIGASGHRGIGVLGERDFFSPNTPSPPNTPMPSLYPANRNAFYRDRDAILETMELPGENLTFSLVKGRSVTIKVWGNALAAEAWLSALVSERLSPPRPFTMEELFKVCELKKINMAVLFFAPAASDAYESLFPQSPTALGQGGEKATVRGCDGAAVHGGEVARWRVAT